MAVFFPVSGKSFSDFKMFNSSEQDTGIASNLPPGNYKLDWNLKQRSYYQANPTMKRLFRNFTWRKLFLWQLLTSLFSGSFIPSFFQLFLIQSVFPMSGLFSPPPYCYF